MELLVPGLILVALMAWLSTKIKKAAAAAYEAETVTTEGFTLEKPEGFIVPVNDASPYIFEARSKDFGTGPAGRLPLARFAVSKLPEKNFEEACQTVRARSGSIVSDDVHLEGKRVCVMETRNGENGVAVRSLIKVIEGEDAVYVLESKLLDEPNADILRKTDEMFRSFSLN